MKGSYEYICKFCNHHLTIIYHDESGYPSRCPCCGEMDQDIFKLICFEEFGTDFKLIATEYYKEGD